MSFANHNILDIALSIIPSTVVQIRKNLGTKVNKFGQSEASYSEWIDVYGIVQPGGEQNEHTQGVDFSKKHVTIWLRGVALDGTHIQWAPDQIRFVDAIFNVVSVKDWYPYDNYRECDCVEALNLGANQRTAPEMPLAEKKSPRRRGTVKKEQEGQQMLAFDAPAEVPAATAATPTPIPQKPAIFAPDEPKKDIAEEVVQPAAPPPRKPSLVGKARIRF